MVMGNKTDALPMLIPHAARYLPEETKRQLYLATDVSGTILNAHQCAAQLTESFLGM